MQLPRRRWECAGNICRNVLPGSRHISL
jgi:hypothetical protein